VGGVTTDLEFMHTYRAYSHMACRLLYSPISDWALRCREWEMNLETLYLGIFGTCGATNNQFVADLPFLIEFSRSQSAEPLFIESAPTEISSVARPCSAASLAHLHPNRTPTPFREYICLVIPTQRGLRGAYRRHAKACPVVLPRSCVRAYGTP
jgi:hypothetical protein